MKLTVPNNHVADIFEVDVLEFEYSPTGVPLDRRMRQFRFVAQDLSVVSTPLRYFCKKYYMLLRSIAGIGGIVACGILYELGDLRRFWSLKHL